MKRFVLVLLIIYLVVYGLLRSIWMDEEGTVIYPVSPIAVYYLFRPLAIADKKLLGINSHIGPHGEL